MNKDLNTKIINNIKALAIDMIDNAKVGHPGICLGAAPILYLLYKNHINFNNKDTKWINRDRFVMSAGHGSALLYSTLFFSGYDITLEDLKSFRKINSKTPGHPEYNCTSGVESTTGPLGQGLGNAIGMAIAERYLNSKFDIIDYNIYVLCSDGDLMEGISYEAASLAGTLKLGKLVVLYDSNNISLDGKTNLTFTEDVLKRFEALNWHVQNVEVNDLDKLNNAIEIAKMTKDKPSIIKVNSIIGEGSLLENTNKVHGTPLTEEDIKQFKIKNDLKPIPFSPSNEAFTEFKNMYLKRTEEVYNNWKTKYSQFDNKDFEFILKNNIKIDISVLFKDMDCSKKEEMRITNQKIMNVISEYIPNFIGGSADLSSSTKTFLEKSGVFSFENYSNKNIFFGVREHLMGAALNGMALSNLRPFGSTFLAFSDYMKPSIRLSAIMDLPATYIFSHDNISIGSDGPTHQPIEQLTMLRSIPNFIVYRPADFKELIGCWNSILNDKKPCALIISKNEVEILKNTDYKYVSKGGYVFKKESNKLSGILISSGTELHIANKIADDLKLKNIDLRVVSMVSIEKFNSQSEEYKKEVIPIGYKNVVIEFSSNSSLNQFVYNSKYLININEFGKSGSKEEILSYFDLDYDSILNKVEKLFK